MKRALTDTAAGRNLAIVIGWVLLAVPVQAAAAPLPTAGQTVAIVAREEPIGNFLRDFFGQLNLPVVVSENVTGTVNGSFEGPAADVLADVARAFNLVTYFDGAVVHVDTAADIATRSFAGSPQDADRVRRTIEELDLTDLRNTVRMTSTGLLVATGTRRFLDQVAAVAAAQAEAGPTEPPLAFRVFYLRYALAQDVTINFGGRQVVVPGVASILRSLVADPYGLTEPTRFSEQYLPPTVSRLRDSGFPALPINGQIDLPPDARPDDPRAGPFTVPDAVQAIDDAFVRIEADTRLNAIIVRDRPDRLGVYTDLVSSLDIEPQLLEIEATIIDVNTDRLRELGINWRFTDGENEVLFGSGTDSDLGLNPGEVITPAGRGLFISTIIGNDTAFISRINALETEGAARIVSRPQVLTLSNVEAIFDNTRTFFVRVAGEDEVDLFNISSGTTLRVTPHVFRDQEQDRIRLLVTIEDGSLTEGQVDEIPIIERSAINTQALILEGESLLIGGLTVESESEEQDKVPLLGDIPILGYAFKTTRRTKERTERLFLISPRLAPLDRRAQADEPPYPDSSGGPQALYFHDTGPAIGPVNRVLSPPNRFGTIVQPARETRSWVRS